MLNILSLENLIINNNLKMKENRVGFEDICSADHHCEYGKGLRCISSKCLCYATRGNNAAYEILFMIQYC